MNIQWPKRGSLFLLIFLSLSLSATQAQVRAKRGAKQATAARDTTDYSQVFHGMQWRLIGPFRGGRSNAAAGVPGQPLVYYFGTTGGGLWKTEDAGSSWKNISDGFFKTGSVGAIAIAPSDPNVIYVGMGEHAVRGVMTFPGDGMYKSTDAGKSWRHIGLPESRHIAEIRVHPNDPELLYVAVQGALHGPSEERGVYRSEDGGESWRKILYVDENTGAADLSMDVTNPRILYAGMWDHRRLPWTVRSGGPGSGLYKSMDGGNSWRKLTEGLPDTLGKVAIDVSPAQPERVYANIEAAGDKGGVYRSDDGGKSWRQTSKDRITVARAWYYIEIFADPQNPDRVYVLNAPMLKSIDGGRTFTSIPNPHGDQHDLWINPEDPENMILANDGGACVTFNGGQSWSTQQNQPTAQFYRVITDNQFPYHVYGGQQDNSTVDIVSRTAGGEIGWKDWRSTAGGESAFLAFDPDDPRYVFGGSYLGNISVYDNEAGVEKDIMAFPVMGLASIPSKMKYRFNWNAPIVAQPQDPKVIYHAGNVVFRSGDRGQSWTVISPDLTRDDTTKQGPGGLPFTNEGAGGENYNTISYLAASPHAAGTLWAGSDDGLVHLTRDDGKNWTNVTPEDPRESLINAIDVSPHAPGTAYLAVNRYKFDDQRPMIYRTTDYGQSWQKIINGLPDNAVVRVVREDPKKKGLLYAGTERGMFISFDQGANWQPFQLNLPITPVLDLTFRDNDLVVATGGRSFWILDDLSPLQQAGGKPAAGLALYQPKPQYRYNLFGSGSAPDDGGQNPPAGLIVYYHLPGIMDSTMLTLEIRNAAGELLRTYHSQTPKGEKADPGRRLLPAKKGVNRFNWDLRRESLPRVEGLSLSGDLRGGLVPPGEYRLRLFAGPDTVTTNATVLPHPKLDYTPADYAAQSALTNEIETTVRDIHTSINRLRKVKAHVESLTTLLKEMDDTEALVDTGQVVIRKLREWEEGLIQARQQTFQDIINFENRLSAELMDLKDRTDGPAPAPTAGARERLQTLTSEWRQQRTALDRIIERDVAAFNALYAKRGLPAIVVPTGTGEGAQD